MKNRKVFLCDCHSIEHQLTVDVMDTTAYFHFYLEDYLSFYKKIINFFYFVFFNKKKFDDKVYIMLNKEEEKELKAHLDFLLTEIGEKNDLV